MVAQCILTLNEGENRFSCARILPSSECRQRTRADVEIRAGGGCFFAHRSVLSTHSTYFRNSALYSNDVLCKVRVQVADLGDSALRAGWNVIQQYCYGRRTNVDIQTALQMLPVALLYRFDELAWVLDAHLRRCALNPHTCTLVYVYAVTIEGQVDGRRPTIVNEMGQMAWGVMVHRFEDVTRWDAVPRSGMVHLLKQHDLMVNSELSVWRAVVSWCEKQEDDEAIFAVGKLVRFGNMNKEDLEEVERSGLLQRSMNLARHVIEQDENEAHAFAPAESRPRRLDAITFTEKVKSVGELQLRGKIETPMQAFGGLLWGVVVLFGEPREGIGLYLKVLHDRGNSTRTRDVNVSVDFSLFCISADGQWMVKKQANEVQFTENGQRIGFPRMAKVHQLRGADGEGNDTGFRVGASIRLRDRQGCGEPIFALDTADDTFEIVFLFPE